MELEASTKFRPREVIRHVLQTSAASLQKVLTLEGHIAEDVPVEIIGDVLRIRQILTNLISNAIKFTHEGKVGIKLYLVPEPFGGKTEDHSTRKTPSKNGDIAEEEPESTATTVWLRCDVYDTGIGIPDNALPTLFKKCMQVSADHARKDGGTGVGLDLCKQLVELMGGRLTVSSRVKCGSTFTFVLPYKISTICDSSDCPDGKISETGDHDSAAEDDTLGFFQFEPRTLGSLNSHKLNRFHVEEGMEMEALPSIWPEYTDSEKTDNVEKPGGDQDMLQEVTIVEEPCIVDFHRLQELTNDTDTGSSELAHLVKNWEYQQADAVRRLREELDSLNRRREEEVDLTKLEDSQIDDVAYWKQRSMHFEKLLDASIQREHVLLGKLQERGTYLETRTSPKEELNTDDKFLHSVLQNAPVVIGHQDKDLKYRFIYNHFPRLQEEDMLGKTDVELFSGAGVKESQDFKQEVLEKGFPAKREITFETELFGSKTFLLYVEPVFSISGETIGVNYIGMDVTDQVRKREKMAKLREEIAVQKAKESELNKAIHITEETMRAKERLAAMSHEIRSPLSGVVSMAEILSTTDLDRDQGKVLNVMICSGDLVLQLINDMLDLSKIESGVMELEVTKFRPGEVVRHVLQTCAASLQKVLTLEGHIADEVPTEIIGDVLRIRQILTNLISNAIKFTHEEKVGINLYLVPDPCWGKSEDHSTRKTPSRNGEIIKEDMEEEPESTATTVWLRCHVYDTGIGIPV